MVNSQLQFPNPALSPFVAYYIAINGTLDAPMHNILSAKGSAALMFPFGAPCDTYMYDFNGHRMPKMVLDEPVLVGPSSTHGKVFMGDKLHFIVVVLQSTGIYHFLKQSVQETTNDVNTLDYFGIKRPFDELQERLWRVKHPNAAIQLIESYLHRYFDAHYFRPNDCSRMTRYILDTQGILSVGALCKTFKRKERYLQQHFIAQTGFSPKTFIRLARFRMLMRHALSNPNASWLDLTAQFEYFDQSHLIKDFYCFTGASPARYFSDFRFTEQLLKQDYMAIDDCNHSNG